MLRADRVGAPQRFIEVFAVPTSKLRGAMIDVIKWTTPLEDTFQLPKVAHITTRIQRHFHIGTQTKTDFIGLMLKVARNNMMPTPAELRDETRSDSSESARYEYAQ